MVEVTPWSETVVRRFGTGTSVIGLRVSLGDADGESSVFGVATCRDFPPFAAAAKR
jgi:hypothetical protein